MTTYLIQWRLPVSTGRASWSLTREQISRMSLAEVEYVYQLVHGGQPRPLPTTSSPVVWDELPPSHVVTRPEELLDAV